jgi:Protein of unknown function (DUF1353)
MDGGHEVRTLTDPTFAYEELSCDWIDGENWRIAREYVYRGPQTVIVPVGFITDFASIPKVLRNILPATGPYGPAAVLHDYMYRTGLWHPGGPKCELRDANGILRLAMIDLQAVPKWQRIAVDAGVAVGGWKTWNRYRAAERLAAAA